MSGGRRKNRFQGKGTLLAVAAAVALGLWVKFGERGPVTEPGEQPPVSTLAGLKADDVTRVELKGDGPPVVVARQGKQWQIEQPIRARADDEQVKQLVSGLLDAHVERIVAENGGDLRAYGLDKPKFAVTLTGAGGKQRVLQVGNKHPAQNSSLYARLADEPAVFMLSSFTVDSLKNKRPDDLRDKTVLAIDVDKAAKVAIEKPHGTVILERKAKDAWELAQPIQAPADKDSVSGLLTMAKDLRVEKFFPEKPTDPQRYGLKPPVLKLAVTDPGGKEATLLLGNLVPGQTTAIYAMRGGDDQLFSVRKTALPDLDKGAMQLRDKTLLSFKRDDLQRLAVTNPAGSVELERAGADWKVTKPFQGKAKKEKLDNLLFSLEELKGVRAVSEKPKALAAYGLDRPPVKVTVWLKGERAPRELLIGKQSPEKTYFAKSSTQDAVFTIPEFTYNDFKFKPAELKG